MVWYFVCPGKRVCCTADGLVQREWLVPVCIEPKSSSRLAKAAFAVNAYADCPTALRAAISHGDAPMVRVLLDHGVDSEARMHQPPEKTTWELACDDNEIRFLLCRAIKEKMEALGSNYRAPHQVSRASPKDKCVLVAYTLHAPASSG